MAFCRSVYSMVGFVRFDYLHYVPSPLLKMLQPGSRNQIQIREFLSRYSGREVLYCPNPGNGGDAFIAHATFRLFEELGIGYETVPYKHITDGMTLFYGGGGNLIEGRYPHAHHFLTNNIGRGNSIVVLPHTVRGYGEFLAGASDVTVICRETVSYDALREAGLPEGRLYLSEDMAFSIDPFDFGVRKQGSGTGFFFRGDVESTGANEIPEGNLDISMCWNGDLWEDPEFTAAVCRSIALHIDRFETVVTDRLHVGIVGALLGKRVLLHPNDYYKIKAVYDHSLHRYLNVTFIDGGAEGRNGGDADDSFSEPAAVEEAQAAPPSDPLNKGQSGLLERLKSQIKHRLFPSRTSDRQET